MKEKRNKAVNKDYEIKFIITNTNHLEANNELLKVKNLVSKYMIGSGENDEK